MVHFNFFFFQRKFLHLSSSLSAQISDVSYTGSCYNDTNVLKTTPAHVSQLPFPLQSIKANILILFLPENVRCYEAAQPCEAVCRQIERQQV